MNVLKQTISKEDTDSDGLFFNFMFLVSVSENQFKCDPMEKEIQLRDRYINSLENRVSILLN